MLVLGWRTNVSSHGQPARHPRAGRYGDATLSARSRTWGFIGHYFNGSCNRRDTIGQGTSLAPVAKGSRAHLSTPLGGGFLLAKEVLRRFTRGGHVVADSSWWSRGRTMVATSGGGCNSVDSSLHDKARSIHVVQEGSYTLCIGQWLEPNWLVH
jgi:hypothetical protein